VPPKQQSRPLKTPEPAVVPGPPPPHFPYWSRHHHNVIPKVQFPPCYGRGRHVEMVRSNAFL
jgi:hypothetical protein